MSVNSSRDLVVVKLGGATLAEEHEVLDGVARAARTTTLVLVHGGGRRLTEWLERLGIESRFEAGRRVTSAEALEVALAVLGGIVNAEIVAALANRGVRAVGMTGIDAGLLRAERVPGLGQVAHVVAIHRLALDPLLSTGCVPVVAPLALDESGTICNVNADEAAAGLAAGLGARLLLLTDTDGVLDAAGRRLVELDRGHATQLIESGVIVGGMLPKVRGALAALEAGAREVVIADGRAPRAVDRAVAGDDFGTRVRLTAD